LAFLLRIKFAIDIVIVHASEPPAHRRLQENESYEDLLLLSECDRGGRVPGAVTTEREEAIDYIRSLGDENWSRGL